MIAILDQDLLYRCAYAQPSHVYSASGLPLDTAYSPEDTGR